MKKKISRLLQILLFSAHTIFIQNGMTSESSKKVSMIRDLETIRNHFAIGYAPADWKKECFDWDLNQSFEIAKNEILELPIISTKQFHQIVRKFFSSARDYHVGVTFYSTEKATLPFTVRGVEGRFFISWIDPARLSPSHHGLHIGDEILEFDERPINEMITEFRQSQKQSSNELTEQRLAEMKLTHRYGMLGDVVPQGTATVTTQSAITNKIIKMQLAWSYTPERILNPSDFLDFLNLQSWLPIGRRGKPNLEIPRVTMATPFHEILISENANLKGTVGSLKSFVPSLGEVLWTNEKKAWQKSEEQNDDSLSEDELEDLLFWHAYIYRHPQGGQVGYIRIPYYSLREGWIKAFAKIIGLMEENTDALVIDQLNNPGGKVSGLYQLLSSLTNQPLSSPHHRIKITQADAFKANLVLEEIQDAESLIDAIGINPFDLSFQELLFLKNYFLNILQDWNRGNHFTAPIPIEGVDRINPHPQHRYTKPILMLINELDFSGGDFAPAILQDNQRALLFGTRTAGAGGFVSHFEFTNRNGIGSCSCTGSIAERVDSQKIENLGVEPDIFYEITIDDIRNDYRGYIQAVNESLIPKNGH